MPRYAKHRSPALPLVFRLPPTCTEYSLLEDETLASALTEREILLAGLSDLHAGYEMGRKTGHHHVLIYTLEGRGHYRTEAGSGTLNAGDLWLVPAGLHHHYWVEKYWRIIWFHPANTARWSLLRADVSQARKARQLQAMERWVTGFLKERLGGSGLARAAAVHHAALIAIALDRELGLDKRPANRGRAEALRGLWAEVSANLQYPWRVADLAKRLHLSETSFCRLVHRHHRQAPMAVVLDLRMQRAKEQLRRTDAPIYQIAARLGYENPFAFSRAFKRETGRSPRQFRNEES